MMLLAANQSQHRILPSLAGAHVLPWIPEWANWATVFLWTIKKKQIQVVLVKSHRVRPA